MSERTEQEERQIGHVVDYCQKNQASMRIRPMRSNLDYLKHKFCHIKPDLIIRGYKKWVNGVV